MENQEKITDQIEEIPTNGSDVEMIKVNTPSFFERHFIHLLVVFALGFLAFIYVFEIHYTPIYIVGQSMQPTINNQSTGSSDTTHTDLIYYRAKNAYSHKDIVIVDASDYLSGDEKSIIKRVIATGGETIKIDVTATERRILGATTYIKLEYDLYVNNQKLKEDYIKEETCYLDFNVNSVSGEFASNSDYTFVNAIYNELRTTPALGFVTTGQYEYTLAEDEYFVCGDNRNNSTDSRYFGPIKSSAILGNVRIHVPYGTNLFIGIWKSLFSAKQIAICK